MSILHIYYEEDGNCWVVYVNKFPSSYTFWKQVTNFSMWTLHICCKVGIVELYTRTSFQAPTVYNKKSLTLICTLHMCCEWHRNFWNEHCCCKIGNCYMWTSFQAPTVSDKKSLTLVCVHCTYLMKEMWTSFKAPTVSDNMSFWYTTMQH